MSATSAISEIPTACFQLRLLYRITTGISPIVFGVSVITLTFFESLSTLKRIVVSGVYTIKSVYSSVRVSIAFR